VRVGTTYIPVMDVDQSVNWYTEKLGAEKTYQDEDKAIINLANQSFFLVKAQSGETANFKDIHGNVRFSMTFEVDGVEALVELNKKLKERAVKVGEIEDRGHPGNNFVFYDLNGNKFDVWSELSPQFKQKKS
jgi:catechol 2,3-dioxygenase-like lactoylglutathione lyase family enzyme